MYSPPRDSRGSSTQSARGLPAPVRTVATAAEAEVLAALLKRAERSQPVVVVSVAREGLRVDPEAIAAALGADADVYVIDNMDAAYDFSDAMPDDTSVYGGAVRAYPAGNAWMQDPYRAPLHTVYTDEDARRVPGWVARDVEYMMPLLPSARSTAEPKAPPRPSALDRGTVTAVDRGRALVELTDGSTAEAALPDLGNAGDPLWLLSPGQSVTGVREGDSFHIEANRPGDAVDRVREGDVIPVLVTGQKTAMVFPGLEVRYRAAAEVGAVVAARIELVGRADGKSWRLVPAAGSDPSVESLPYVAGGRPWLQFPGARPEERTELPAPTPAPAPEAPPVREGDADEEALAALDLARSRLTHLRAENARLAHENERAEKAIEELSAQLAEPPKGQAPSPAEAAAVAGYRAQIAALRADRTAMVRDLESTIDEADDLARSNASLRSQVASLQEAVRTERQRANRTRRENARVAEEEASAVLFSDPEQQFRHEVYVEWAERIPAATKAELPLADYALDEGFLESVESLQGIDRSKIIAVAVEVLTGLAETMAGRDMHRLRDGVPGNAPVLTHPEYGTGWRVNLQTGTASARRMHFWRGADGKIVFLSVGVHDDSAV